MTQEFYSHGKLLITGEYVVLDGATALAIPTKKGQHLKVTPIDKKVLQWRSILADGTTWFSAEFTLPLSQRRIHNPIKMRLLAILLAIQDLNAELFVQGWNFEATLEFDRSWGLGSSSTLINNLANWAQIDPFELLEKTFGGSGYDIACAQTDTPLHYKLKPEGPSWKPVIFNPSFKDELFFVYLNKKQNSRESILHYRSQNTNEINEAISHISAITEKIIQASTLVEFETLLESHERIISKIIKTPTVKEQFFPDYPRTIKSLGGWGGDFILATGSINERKYFINKGYQTLLTFSEMIY